MRRLALALCVTGLPLLLAACNSTGGGAPAPAASTAPPAGAYAGLPAGVSPPGFKLPTGTGCAASIARWQAIQDNDLNSGHVGQSVYNQIQKEIDQASAACQAGKEAEAESLVRASRARHGYPAG
jgi:hypothetical protein